MNQMEAFTGKAESPAQHSAVRGMPRPYLLVLLVALVLRGLWAALVPVVPVSDGATYDLFARNLAAGLGYGWGPGHPTAYWPVGASFIYSLLYRAFGLSYLSVLLFNIAVSCATIWVTMILAERWFNRRVAFLTGMVLALWPIQIEFVTLLSSELLFNFFLVVWLLLWEKRGQNPWVKGIAIGVLAAGATYIRPVSLVLPIMLCALQMARRREYVRPILATAFVYLIMALLVAPWSIRNTRIFGHFVTISTNYGANLWMGNHSVGEGETVDLPPGTIQMQESVRDIYLRRIAIDYIEEHPVRFVLRTALKAFLLHSHETIGVHWNMPGLVKAYGEGVLKPLKAISNLYWWATLGLGLWGVWLIFRWHGFWSLFRSPAFMMWYYFTAIYSILVVQDRYHFSSTPFIAVLAAVSLAGIGERYRIFRANA